MHIEQNKNGFTNPQSCCILHNNRYSDRQQVLHLEHKLEHKPEEQQRQVQENTRGITGQLDSAVLWDIGMAKQGGPCLALLAINAPTCVPAWDRAHMLGNVQVF